MRVILPNSFARKGTNFFAPSRALSLLLLFLWLGTEMQAQNCEPNLSISCPPNIEVDCNEGLNPDPSLSGMPEVSVDECFDGEVNIGYEDTILSSDDCSTQISRVWMVEAGGESDMCNQVIEVVDNEAPQLLMPPLYYSFDVTDYDGNFGADLESGSVSLEQLGILFNVELVQQGFFFPQAEDNCDPQVTPYYVQELIPASELECPLVAVVNWSFFAQDDCGNLTGPITIVCDFFDPEGCSECAVACPADLTVNCTDDLSVEALGSPSILGDCGEVDMSFSEVMSGDDCISIITRTWEIFISGQEPVVCTQTITVVDFDGPAFIDFPEDMMVSCIEEVPAPVEVSAEDACNEVVGIEIFTSETGNPIEECVASTAFGPGDDWALWLPTFETDGLAATDDFVPVDSLQFIQYADGTAHFFGLVENNTNPDQQFYIDFWLQNRRNWTEWSGLGRSYKDSFGHAAAGGNLWETWSYYEMVDGFSTLTGAGDFAGSVLYMYHMPDNYYFGFQCGEAANDRNPNFGMSGWFTFSGVFNGEFIEGHGDINVDKECQEPQNPQECVNDDEFTYFYRAEDSCGNATIESYSIVVNDEIAPEFTVVPEDLTVECDAPEVPVFEGIEAEDNCECGVASILYLGEELVEGGNDCLYQLERTWAAFDCCDNRTDYVQTITVVDTTAPEVTFVPEDLTIECDQEVPVVLAEGVDNCQEVAVDYSDEITEGDCPQEYTITRTFTLSDGCDNVSTAQQIINVVDTTAPVFGEYDIQVAVECTEVDMVEGPSATDNCGEVSITFEDILQSGGCLGVIERTYTAVDECGNSATAVQYITVLDTIAPIIENPADETVECDNVPETPGADGIEIYDNCGLEVTVEFTEEIIDGDCEDNYTIVWTWVATDFCENQSTASTTITVVDTTNPEFVVVPEDATYECDEEVPACDVSLVEATDNCDMDVVIECTDEIIDGDCPQEYTINRVYRAFDNCGNQAIYVQTINVVDTTAPEFASSNATYLVYECDEEVPVVDVEATDNCGEVSLSYVDGEIMDGNCPQNYSFIRTWTAVDECGNDMTLEVTIEVLDTTAPVIEGEISISAPCDDYDMAFITAEDNCGVVNIEWVDMLQSGGCAGNVLRTYTVSDECGNESSFLQILSLEDVTAPEFVSVPEDMTYECDEEVPACDPSDVSVEDNCTEVLSVTCSDEIVDGDCPQEFTILRTYTAIDQCDNVGTYTQTINIVDTTAPEFTFVAEDATVECDQELPAPAAEATDNCGAVSIEVSSEMFDGDCANEYTMVRTYTATDECGNASTATQTITVVDTTAPVFTSVAADATVECDQELPAPAAEATDNCGDVSIEVTSEMIEGDCPQEYTMIRTYTATDACGNASTATQTINVVDTTAPVFDAHSVEVEAPCDNPEVAILTATDNCGDLVVSFNDQQVSGGCAGIIIRDYTAVDACGNTATTQQIITLIDEVAPIFVETPADATYECDQEFPSASIEDVAVEDNCTDVVVSVEENITNGDCPQEFTITRTYTAVDNCDNVSTYEQTITIVDTTAPEFTFVAEDATVECDQELPAPAAEATDNCGAVSIEVSSEMFDGECANEYTMVRTYTATDECGNASTATQTITVVDTTAPVFTSVAADATVECDEELPAPAAEATDNCGDVSIDVSSEMIEGDCPQEYTMIRTYTATDACGNASTATQTITVVDTTAPVFEEHSVQLEAPCDNPAVSILTATDNCGPVVVEFIDQMVSGGCADTIIRNYTAVDACGNTATTQQIITLIDEVAPIFVETPADATYECDEEFPGASIEDVAVEDNCTDVTVSVEENITNGDCPQEFTITRTYTAVDNCDNVSTYEQTINIVDTTAPVFTFVAEDATVECDQELPAPAAEATDNCGEVSIEVSSEMFDGECANEYTMVRTYTASDECGNASTATQTITVVDTTAPVFTSVAADATVECDEELPAPAAEATDNCGEVTIDVTSEMIEGDCPQEYTMIRTYTATDECGNSTTETQTINVVDTTGPVLVGSPETNLVLDCEDEVPAPDAPGFEDNCDENLQLFFSEEIIGDLPAEGSSADCVALTPEAVNNGLDCTNNEPWSLVLFGLGGMDARYSAITANWVEYPDGSATLTGIVAGNDNPNGGWEISANFENGLNWEEWSTQVFPTSYKDDCDLGAPHFQDWTYYIMSAGATLIGWGDYEGSTLSLAHAPSNLYYGYQVGVAANNVNQNYGGGGWFTYTGIVDGVEVTGAGDFAFDHDCCPQYQIERTWCAADCAGNETCFTQTISFEDLQNGSDAPIVVGPDASEKGDFFITSVAPNPAKDFTQIDFYTKVSTQVRLELIDLNGKVLDVIYEGAIHSEEHYRRVLRTNDLNSGVYILRLVSLYHADHQRVMVTH